MKGRESGMPEERYWNSFFDADCVVRKLFGEKGCQGDVVEFGCGYGTFTFPAARHSMGNVFALDIEPDLIEILRQKAGKSLFRTYAPASGIFWPRARDSSRALNHTQ